MVSERGEAERVNRHQLLFTYLLSERSERVNGDL